MIKSIISGVVAAILLASAACSSSEPNPHAEDDIEGIHNYARQVLPILESVSTGNRQMVDAIGRSMQKGENYTVFYDQAQAIATLDKMSGEFEQKQREFEALAVPKGAHDFPASVEDYFDKERSFLEQIRGELAAGNNRMPLNKWNQLAEKSRLLFYHSRRLTSLAKQALNQPETPAEQKANGNQP